MTLREFGLLSVLAIACLWPTSAQSEVNPKDGNYYISYTDLIADDLVSTRTYNSKSVGSGMFGLGWGSPLESIIEVGPAGTPVILHGLKGMVGYFEPVEDAEKYERQLAESITRMLEIHTKHQIDEYAGDVTPDVRERIREQLRQELAQPEVRHRTWQRLLDTGQVEPIPIEIGARFRSQCECSAKYYEATRIENGFEVRVGDGGVETFDDDGRLTSFRPSALEGTIALDRDRSGPTEGRLRRATLDGRSIYFFYNEQGHVHRLFEPVTGKWASYRYDVDKLIASVDAAGNEYAYEYDDKYNLTVIRDGREAVYRRIQYDPSTGFAIKTTERDGEVHEYEYGDFPDQPKYNYYTRVMHTLPPERGGYVSHELREYHLLPAEDGGAQTVRTVIEADLIRREWFYDDGVIVKLVERSKVAPFPQAETRFEFDPSGRVTKTVGGDWSRSVEYEDAASTRVATITRVYGVERSVYSFAYDGDDRLSRARHDGVEIEIEYEGDSTRVLELHWEDRWLRFDRNDAGQLVRLHDETGASIHVSRDEGGRTVVSYADPKAALRITSLLTGALVMIEAAHAKIDIEQLP